MVGKRASWHLFPPPISRCGMFESKEISSEEESWLEAVSSSSSEDQGQSLAFFSRASLSRVRTTESSLNSSLVGFSLRNHAERLRDALKPISIDVSFSMRLHLSLPFSPTARAPHHLSSLTNH